MNKERETDISIQRIDGFGEVSLGTVIMWGAIVSRGNELAATLMREKGTDAVDFATFASAYVHDTGLFLGALATIAFSTVLIGDGIRRMENAKRIVDQQHIKTNK